VTASGIKLIGKETERGWEQDDDISTLLPQLIRYDRSDATLSARLQEKLHDMSIDTGRAKTGLSRNTILRARRGLKIRPKSATTPKDAIPRTTRKTPFGKCSWTNKTVAPRVPAIDRLPSFRVHLQPLWPAYWQELPNLFVCLQCRA